jgi:hypothetical protein
VGFDGDGKGDILTGSYPGPLYLFKGKGNGEFAAPVKLQRDGKDINLGPPPPCSPLIGGGPAGLTCWSAICMAICT